MRKAISFLLVALAASAAVVAQSTDGRRSTVAPERLSRIDQALQQYVDENRVAGVVALVLRDGRPAYERAVGGATGKPAGG